MKPTLLLRIGTGVSAVMALGHLSGGLGQWSPVGKVTDQHFIVEGVNRSYLDFYLGFGWTIGILLLMRTALLWQVAALAQSDAARARPMIAMFATGTLASAVVASRLILPVPTIFECTLFVVLAAAFVAAGRVSRKGSATGEQDPAMSI